MAYGVSFGVPKTVLGVTGPYSACLLCSEVEEAADFSSKRSFNLDPNRRTFRTCFNNGENIDVAIKSLDLMLEQLFYAGYANDHLYNQLFKCGNAEDFLQSFAKNTSDDMSYLGCRKGLGTDEDSIQYEVKFRPEDVAVANVDRVRQNWKGFGSLNLGNQNIQ